MTTVSRVEIRLLFVFLALACALCGAVRAQPLAPELAAQVTSWARGTAGAAGDKRVEVEVGQLNPRLQLAPCTRIEPYLPRGSRPWGRTRVGLRCTEGAAAWNVYLPVTVHLWAPAPVLREARPAGYALQAADFVLREADWAAGAKPPLTDAARLVGRTLARPLDAGDPVRGDDLRQRLWFAAGDTVQVIARGRGYAVSGEGLALTRGLEGQRARVRTSSGRVVSGLAVAANRIEVSL